MIFLLKKLLQAQQTIFFLVVLKVSRYQKQLAAHPSKTAGKVPAAWILDYNLMIKACSLASSLLSSH